MSKIYSVIMDETLVQTATYIVRASSPEEAKEKALLGQTESIDIEPDSTELTHRQVRYVEDED